MSALSNPHLQAALQRLCQAFDQALSQTQETAGQLAGSALKSARRDELLLTQALLRQQQSVLIDQFQRSLLSEWEKDGLGKAVGAVPARSSGWGELSLVDDAAVDALVAADRIGKALGHSCEWELRAVESFVSDLLGDPEAGPDRNPVRPGLVARALIHAVDDVTDQPNLRQTLSEELTRTLSGQMKSCYADLAAWFRQKGLRAQDLRAITTEGGSRGGAAGAAPEPAPPFSNSGPDGLSSAPGGHGAPGTQPPGGYPAPIGALGGLGHVEPVVMNLLRRLHGAAPAVSFSTLADPTAGLAMPSNLIQLHREELRQTATAPLDHMVIDVVATLFDAILADSRVPPQMARLLGRLQLPVLRAALGDTSFFAKRNHPVRRFINRLASLACSFEDFTQDPGLSFLKRVSELVEEIAGGDFERLETYDKQLDQLDQFVTEQAKQALSAAGQEAARKLEEKELQARQRLQYEKQLDRALQDLPLPGFLKQFLCKDWGAVIVTASGQGEPQALMARRQGRDLAVSVLPKGGSPARKDFLSQLPLLVRGVQLGLDSIGCPESTRKQLFADLMPVHAEALKTPALSPLDHNLLVKRIEAAFGLAVPDEQEALRATTSLDINLEEAFNPAEAAQMGLLTEAQVPWDGQVDIDLSAEPDTPVQTVDLAIAGLPEPESPEPTHGAALFDHLQIGCAYRIHTGKDWHKVKLTHISDQRSFFIFTEGDHHPKTLTMTARMLRRLCANERFRSVENAFLLERATARARQQLAALMPQVSRH
ncbi:DUF1631 family protein [Inhella gelatinilytica]|uniref:DUF1631 family protein n=1 Tax=Inhella gelatinilytica TaxID=2795030 RepID=A0A931IY81_9BURK|nr:DUF1631 family protein [Inhella gelatinilytica]MBH9553259.1 DUF1631 family protein [Inhella gelatinilytica]